MKVLYFAWVKERTGTAEEDVRPPASVATVGDLLAWLGEKSPGHAEALSETSRLRIAVNQEMADAGTPVSADDEIAVFPPMTGGAA